jgi:hypothetical protein
VRLSAIHDKNLAVPAVFFLSSAILFLCLTVPRQCVNLVLPLSFPSCLARFQLGFQTRSSERAYYRSRDGRLTLVSMTNTQKIDFLNVAP